MDRYLSKMRWPLSSRLKNESKNSLKKKLMKRGKDRKMTMNSFTNRSVVPRFI